MDSPVPFTLLGPLADGGEFDRAPMPGEALAGWTQVRLLFSDGAGAMRIVVGMFDTAGRPGMISDLVATERGTKQETVGGRVEPDGRIEGTHWLSEGDRHTPRPVTDAEREKLRELADALWAYPSQD